MNFKTQKVLKGTNGFQNVLLEVKGQKIMSENSCKSTQSIMFLMGVHSLVGQFNKLCSLVSSVQLAQFHE